MVKALLLKVVPLGAIFLVGLASTAHAIIICSVGPVTRGRSMS